MLSKSGLAAKEDSRSSIKKKETMKNTIKEVVYKRLVCNVIKKRNQSLEYRFLIQIFNYLWSINNNNKLKFFFYYLI